MLNVHVDNLGDVSIVECEGRIVTSQAAFTLRDAVTCQTNARTVILDLSEVDALGGGAVGMLAFLQRWAHDHEIRMKLFNPSRSLCERLAQTTSIPAFEFATIDEVLAYLSRSGSQGGVSGAIRYDHPSIAGERHG